LKPSKSTKRYNLQKKFPHGIYVNSDRVFILYPLAWVVERRTVLKNDRVGVTVGPMDERKILVNGAVIRYLEAGEGAPLLLLPSAAGRATEYQPLIPLLEEDFHVYSIDYPGFGQSDLLEGVTGTDALADFVLNWMEAVGLRRSHLAGFSLGGWVALSLALSNPDRISSLILIATSAGKLPHISILNPSGMSHKEILDRFYHRPEIKERLARQKLSSTEKEELLRSSRALARLVRQGDLIPRFDHRLREIKAPTLIISADRDQAIPVPYQERLHAGIAQSEWVIFSETGHAIVAERPEALAEAIRNFLKNSI
jgi:pimeloyl-ACP methyl ester carboxylesterase